MCNLRWRNVASKTRSGIAALEFAFIAPVLVFLMLGMLEGARAIQVKEILTDAARKGCRTGLPSTGSNAAVTADINSVLTSNGIASGNVTITIQVNSKSVDVSTAAANTPISVKVSVPFANVSFIAGYFVTSANIQSETIVMMSQR